MTYPNACKGLEKIHYAEIMLIISTILVSICEAITDEDGFNISLDDMSPVFMIVIIVVLAIGAILAAVADIMNLVGLKKASKDSGLFLIPFYVTLVLLIVDIGAGIFLATEHNVVVSEIVETFKEIIETVQMVIVITTSMKMAKSLNGINHVKTSKLMLTFVIISIAVSFIAGLMSVFIEGAGAISEGIYHVLETVSFIIYLVYVDKTIKFLEEN